MATRITVHRDAPSKPDWGAPCNGCGICCAAEPCAVGRLLLRQQGGACRVLLWEGAQRRYRCGALAYRRPVWLPSPVDTLLRRLLRRWIAAGAGCDSDAVVQDGAGRDA